MTTFGEGTFGGGTFGEPDVWLPGGYKRWQWRMRWDDNYNGPIGVGTTGTEIMHYAAPQLEVGEIPTAFATRPDELLPGSVEGGGGAGHIAAETIIGDDILAESITADQIAANTITGSKIAANTITGGRIAAGTIEGANIAGGTITANKMNVSVLSAISADLGSITAGTITGALIRTEASGARVELDEFGLRQYDSGSNVTVEIPSDGTEATFTGTINALGIELPLDSFSSGTTESRIAWRDPFSGALRSEIYTYGGNFSPFGLSASVWKTPAADQISSNEVVYWNISNPPTNESRAMLSVNNRNMILLNQDGGSDFIQGPNPTDIDVPEKVRMASGNVGIFFDNSTYGAAVVETGLYATPDQVALTAIDGSNNNSILAFRWFSAGPEFPNHFYVVAKTVTGAAIGPGNVNASWHATVKG